MGIQINILDFGAKNGCTDIQTPAIQAAIDACREAGGGEVLIPSGVWYTASIRLYSNITLHLQNNAQLIASSNWKDYTDYQVPTTLAYVTDPYFIEFWNLPKHYLNAVITAIECENVSVIGEEGSEINGSNCYDPAGEEKFRGPMGMVFCKCKNVTLNGYRFVDSANWSHQLDSCCNVAISNVNIYGGHDGFNVHHCTNVTVSGCDLQTGDDCIAGYDVHNFHMKECLLNTSCNTFRIGCENLLVENCRFYAPGKYPHRISGRTNTLYAFEYYSHQADPVQTVSCNWVIRNCTFDGLDALLNYDFGNELHLQVISPLSDVTFRDVIITGLTLPSSFMGKDGGRCSLTLDNVKVTLDEEADNNIFLKIDEQARLKILNTNFIGKRAQIIVSDKSQIENVCSEGFTLATMK